MHTREGSKMFGIGNMPKMYNLVINSNSNLAEKIFNTENSNSKKY